jgi:SAM-dependent methyltransferase
MVKNQMENIYRNRHPDEIPWNIETPPDLLVSLLAEGKIAPCKTVDYGCGTGNYAIFLAGKGFDVTGIDISPSAIEIAKKTAYQQGMTCDFIVADVLSEMPKVQYTFDFAYDWELLHHVFPPDRQKYVENVYRCLNPGGKYLSVCFSEEDLAFGGAGQYRKTPLGTVLYFSSEKELQFLFEPFFFVEELRTIEIKGKTEPHKAIYAFMKKDTDK